MVDNQPIGGLRPQPLALVVLRFMTTFTCIHHNESLTIAFCEFNTLFECGMTFGSRNECNENCDVLMLE